jgi:hypothetical protein
VVMGKAGGRRLRVYAPAKIVKILWEVVWVGGLRSRGVESKESGPRSPSHERMSRSVQKRGGEDNR